MNIRDLEKREDLILLQNDGDIIEMQSETGTDYDGFLVRIKDGEYVEIYGFYGMVPVLTKTAWQVRP